MPRQHFANADRLVVEEIGDEKMISQVQTRPCGIKLAVFVAKLSGHPLIVIGAFRSAKVALLLLPFAPRK